MEKNPARMLLFAAFVLALMLSACGRNEETDGGNSSSSTAAGSVSLVRYVPAEAFGAVRQDLAACSETGFSRILHKDPRRISILSLLGGMLAPEDCRGESMLFIMPGGPDETVRLGAVIRFDEPCVREILAHIRNSFSRRGLFTSERTIGGREGLLLTGRGRQTLLVCEAPDLLQMTVFTGKEPETLYRADGGSSVAEELPGSGAFAFAYDLGKMPEAARAAFTGGEAPETDLVRGFIRPSENGAFFQIETRAAEGRPCGAAEPFLRRLAGGPGELKKENDGRLICEGRLAPVKDRHQVFCDSNLKQIHAALLEYAESHDGAFPAESGAEGLDALRKNTLPTARLYICAVGDAVPATVFEPLTEHNSSYAYFGGLRREDGLPLLIEYPSAHPDGAFGVLYADGTIRRLPGTGTDLAARFRLALGHEPSGEQETGLLRQAERLSVLRRR